MSTTWLLVALGWAAAVIARAVWKDRKMEAVYRRGEAIAARMESMPHGDERRALLDELIKVHRELKRMEGGQ